LNCAMGPPLPALAETTHTPDFKVVVKPLAERYDPNVSCRALARKVDYRVELLATCARSEAFNRVKAVSDIIPISEFYGVMPANLITLAHFSISSAMNLPKSAGEPGSTVPPTSARRALNLASARPALISLLSLSVI
jgi:hypothetical protein